MDVFKQNAKNKNTKKATSNEILTVPKYQTSKGNVVIGRKFSRIIIVKTIWTRSCYCLVVLCFKVAHRETRCVDFSQLVFENTSRMECE